MSRQKEKYSDFLFAKSKKFIELCCGKHKVLWHTKKEKRIIVSWWVKRKNRMPAQARASLKMPIFHKLKLARKREGGT